MIKVLFICHGNICRSTMAQSVFSYMLQKSGLETVCEVDSAATSREEIGNPPHHGTVAKLRQVGIPVVPHSARQMTESDYHYYDYIIGMDSWNMKNLLRMTKGDPERKLYKMLSFANFETTGGLGEAQDVADPWYTGDFDATYQDVLSGCRGLLAFLGLSAKNEK